MWLRRTLLLPILFSFAICEKNADDDASSAFLEVAKTFFSDRNNLEVVQGIASTFVQSDTGKQIGQMMGGEKSNMDGMGQLLSGVGSLFLDQNRHGGGDYSMLGTIVDNLFNGERSNSGETGEVRRRRESGSNLDNLASVGNMFLGQNGAFLMGLVPMLLQNLGNSENSGEAPIPHDHSGHSWYMPPILETIHVMWDHFSSSELGQALWKDSGLSKIVAQMKDEQGYIQYEKILDSLESPALRRRWIKSLTTYVAEWISHISDPAIQHRYLATLQFVGNSFLKSQGYPKTAMFDSNRPSESISRLFDTVARRHLGMKVDSSMYIRPAIAYFQELVALASEKGFIMSRVNARELSNRLADTINNDLIEPVLKAYRAYKWALKSPHCASQILCTINERRPEDDNATRLRPILLRATSFPAAWAVSNKLEMNFWVLYGAIMEENGCIEKYPAECTAFHEEELRVTTEAVHNEL